MATFTLTLGLLSVRRRDRSLQCCTCSKWVLLRCLLLSYSRFKTLGCCVPVSFGDSTPANTISSSLGSSSLYTFTVQSGPPLLTQRCRSTIVFKPFTLLPPTWYLLSLHPPSPFHASDCFSILPASSPDSLSVLQCNARGLRVRSSKLLQFISFYPMDLICIQESKLNSSSRFLDTLQSDRIRSLSSILSPDDPHANDGLIFVRQGLSSELSSTNDPDTPIVFLRSSPDISFALSSCSS